MEDIKKDVDLYKDTKKAFAVFTVLLAACLCQYIKENEEELRALIENKTEVKTNDCQ